MISNSAPRSTISPSLEIPSPYAISNFAVLNGGATLFLTTLTLVSFPTISSLFLIDPVFLISNLTEA